MSWGSEKRLFFPFLADPDASFQMNPDPDHITEIMKISDTTFHISLDPDLIFHINPDYLTLEIIPDLDPTC
jgi:hypothetical protein